MARGRDLEIEASSAKGSLARREYLEKLALPRIMRLPGRFQTMLDVEHLGPMQLTADDQGVVFELGAVLKLTIYPFEDQYVLEDLAGKMAPMRKNFGIQGRFSESEILQIVGYHELATRADEMQTPEILAGMLGDLGTLVSRAAPEHGSGGMEN